MNVSNDKKHRRVRVLCSKVGVIVLGGYRSFFCRSCTFLFHVVCVCAHPCPIIIICTHTHVYIAIFLSFFYNCILYIVLLSLMLLFRFVPYPNNGTLLVKHRGTFFFCFMNMFGGYKQQLSGQGMLFYFMCFYLTNSIRYHYLCQTCLGC